MKWKMYSGTHKLEIKETFFNRLKSIRIGTIGARIYFYLFSFFKFPCEKSEIKKDSKKNLFL